MAGERDKDSRGGRDGGEIFKETCVTEAASEVAVRGGGPDVYRGVVGGHRCGMLVVRLCSLCSLCRRALCNRSVALRRDSNVWQLYLLNAVCRGSPSAVRRCSAFAQALIMQAKS